MSESQDSKKKDENIESDYSEENDSLYSQESIYKQREDPRLHRLIAGLSHEDSLRYESFRRSNFPKGTIKKFISNTIGQAVNPNIVIGVSGLCKIFVGEMVIEAKKVQEEEGFSGPIMPSHMHEAYRRLYKKIPNMRVHKKEPWNS